MCPIRGTAVACQRNAHFQCAPAELQSLADVPRASCHAPGAELQRHRREGRRGVTAVEALVEDLQDLVQPVWREVHADDAEAARDTRQQPLRQVHGVRDRNDRKAGLRHREPVEDVVQHGLVLRDELVHLVHKEDDDRLRVAALAEEARELTMRRSRSALAQTLGALLAKLAVKVTEDSTGLPEAHGIDVREEEGRRALALLQLPHGVEDGGRLASSRHPGQEEHLRAATLLHSRSHVLLDPRILRIAAWEPALEAVGLHGHHSAV